jgi:hypothetical protein
MSLLLLQTTAANATPSWVPLVVQIGLAITAVIIGTVVVMLVRRRYSQQQDDPGAGGVGLMEQLRQMNREGKISDEELAAIRGKMRDSLRQQVGMANGKSGAKVQQPKEIDPALLAAKRAVMEEQMRMRGVGSSGGAAGAGSQGKPSEPKGSVKSVAGEVTPKQKPRAAGEWPDIQ